MVRGINEIQSFRPGIPRAEWPPGRPPIAEEIQALIVRMATENGWRARKIREELGKAGNPVRSIPSFGICPKRTALQSPWQNGTAERFVGSVRRELLDHVVVLHDHLRRLLREYIEYYNTERVHTAISDAPSIDPRLRPR